MDIVNSPQFFRQFWNNDDGERCQGQQCVFESLISYYHYCTLSFWLILMLPYMCRSMKDTLSVLYFIVDNDRIIEHLLTTNNTIIVLLFYVCVMVWSASSFCMGFKTRTPSSCDRITHVRATYTLYGQSCRMLRKRIPIVYICTLWYILYVVPCWVFVPHTQNTCKKFGRVDEKISKIIITINQSNQLCVGGYILLILLLLERYF